jgi:hypothetical protein
MSSHTIDCIGLGKDRDGRRTIYEAQNRTEVMQERNRAAKTGDIILEWYAQTSAGVRVLGSVCSGVWVHVMDSFVPSVHMVTCPICEGDGHNGKYFCPVCHGSGISRSGNEKHWMAWQLDSMRAERAKVENHGTL